MRKLIRERVNLAKHTVQLAGEVGVNLDFALGGMREPSNEAAEFVSVLRA